MGEGNLKARMAASRVFEIQWEADTAALPAVCAAIIQAIIAL
jgi:hypothetical protein